MPKTTRHRAAGRRAGFTLIELLVVIFIIAILIGLVAGGIFQYVAAQKQANTETLIRTLDKTLQRQWDAVVSEAKKETPSAAVLDLAGGDQRRAQVIHIKLRLVEAFPVSFAEINTPLIYANSPFTGTPFITKTQQKNLATFKTALAQAGVTAGGPGESIACLILSLQQSRGGVAGLNLDQIAYAVSNYTAAGVLASASNQSNIKIAVDGWGNPLAFVRFPSNRTELDATNPATAGSTAAKFRDPLDPEGLLGYTLPKVQPTAWSNQANYYQGGAKGRVYYFEQITQSKVHAGAQQEAPGAPIALASATFPWPPPTAFPVAGQWVPAAYYSVPVIVSAGPDGQFNYDAMMGQYDQVTATKIHVDDDDILSYKLRLGARGD
jgi:prepilin-type N-terminal cleavage/methylation domain-containing protein